MTDGLARSVEMFAERNDLSDDEYTRLIDAVHVIEEYEDTPDRMDADLGTDRGIDARTTDEVYQLADEAVAHLHSIRSKLGHEIVDGVGIDFTTVEHDLEVIRRRTDPVHRRDE